MLPPPPSSTLFPYTTLFRSHPLAPHRRPRPGLPRLGGHIAEAAAGSGRRRPLLPHLERQRAPRRAQDRKSTRLNSSHMSISYAVFCLKKKKTQSYTTPYTTL